MDYLWQSRHKTSDLMGVVININNGDWVRKGGYMFVDVILSFNKCTQRVAPCETFVELTKPQYGAADGRFKKLY